MPGSGSEGVSQSGKTSALDDLSLLLARWEGPVPYPCFLYHSASHALPLVTIAPFLTSWWRSQGMGSHGLWFYNVTTVGVGEGGCTMYFSEIFNIFKYQ